MRKATKADLTKKLEGEVSFLVQYQALPSFAKENTVYIRDTIGLINNWKPSPLSTFNSLADDHADNVIKSYAFANTVVDVFDRYDNADSVKAVERVQRESTVQGRLVYEVLGGRVVPPWEKFLNIAANKMQLNAFLSQQMESLVVSKLNEEQSYFLSGGYTEGMEAIKS